MAERSNAHDSKSCYAGMYTRVQIPFSAPDNKRVSATFTEALFSCQNGGIPTISRHTAQTENVRKCTPMSTFPVPSKVPELSTQQDMLTTALQIRHSVRASHERGGSVFLIITPVHAHRHVQRLRRHIRRNPRRNAPIRRNIQPSTLQTTPSLTIAARRRTGSLML